MHRCPCCGRELDCPGLIWLPLAGVFVRSSDQQAAHFSVREAAVFNALWQGYVSRANHPTPMRKLVEASYQNDPNGGPDTAQLCVYQIIHRLKKKLKPFGFRLFVRNCAVTLCQTMEESHDPPDRDARLYRAAC